MMFWRILGRLFRASRGRLAVAFIALASGAAITTALVNLHFDAESKVSGEFRTLGANVLILPQADSLRTLRTDPAVSPLMNEDVMGRLEAIPEAAHATPAPFLYVVANISVGSQSQQVIVTGTLLDRASRLAPWWKITGESVTDPNDAGHCLVGRTVAKQFGLIPGSRISLQYEGKNGASEAGLTVAGVIESGGDEDNQILAQLTTVQKLAGEGGRIALIQLNLPGTPSEFFAALRRISSGLPNLDVRPIPQIAQAEGQLLPRIQGLIYAMVALILVLTALCVFASMAALAMERRRDVGLMKAIGGKMSRIVAIFLTEAGALGLAGALIGYVAGIFLSRWIGWQAFGVAINARLEVLPLVVALMVGVSLAGAFPLRLLGRIRPAEILRGE
jgi:putative ABC transport system permease protein